MTRYALYAAPAPDTPLWSFGSGVIGYDAATGADVALLPGFPFSRPDWSELTADPRVYGFHATLKAPFRLAPGTTLPQLLEASMVFAERRSSLDLHLRTVLHHGFCALMTDGPRSDLHSLAADVVEAFEPFRAPLTAKELERRLPARLTPRQRSLLDTYGYPHVMEEFAFHMTLTGRLPPDLGDPVRDALAHAHAALDPVFRLDALVVFEQPAPDQRFRVLARFPFEG